MRSADRSIRTRRRTIEAGSSRWWGSRRTCDRGNGAADRQAEEDRADRAGDLGQLGLPFDLGDDVSAHDLAGPAPAEARGDQGIAIAGREIIAGDLQHQEAIVRKIGVQSVHDPVAIAPGVGAFGVELEAVGIGVVSQVEPVLAPALSILRAGEQAIDQALVGVGRVSPTKAATSSGEGGRPVRSNVTRRIKATRSASGACTIPSFSSSARMKRSIGFLTQPDSLTAGGATRVSRADRPSVRAVLARMFREERNRPDADGLSPARLQEANDQEQGQLKRGGISWHGHLAREALGWTRA